MMPTMLISGHTQNDELLSVLRLLATYMYKIPGNTVFISVPPEVL